MVRPGQFSSASNGHAVPYSIDTPVENTLVAVVNSNKTNLSTEILKILIKIILPWFLFTYPTRN